MQLADFLSLTTLALLIVAQSVKPETYTLPIGGLTYNNPDLFENFTLELWYPYYGDIDAHCRYYGDCENGDIVRIRERLDRDVYKCMNVGNYTQGYVVYRCPEGSSEELSQLCANPQSQQPDFSLSEWPVTGSYTGITYSNMYCAICNGAMDPVTDQLDVEEFDRYKSLDFWSMNIWCTNDTAGLFLPDEESEAGLEKLKNLVITRQPDNCRFCPQKLCLNFYTLSNRECWMKYTPPKETKVHAQKCGSVIDYCPSQYTNMEISNLCIYGPYNLVPDEIVDVDKQLWYRNAFCQHCWKDSTLPERIEPPTNQTDNEGERLMVTITPIIQTEEHQSLSKELFSPPPLQSDFYIELPNNLSDYWIINKTADEEASIGEGMNHTLESHWNLGSILCRSEFGRICGDLVHFGASDRCTGPGCGNYSVQGADNSCIDVSRYHYDKTITYNRTFQWPMGLINGYFSRCSLVPLDGNDRNCRCDEQCHYFGDCCVDAPSPPTNFREPASKLSFACQTTTVPINESASITETHIYSFHSINSCPHTASESEKINCDESKEYIGLNISSWPVSDLSTNLTYANIYCASCHGVSDVSWWNPIVKCNWGARITSDVCESHGFIPQTSLGKSLFRRCEDYIDFCPPGFEKWKLKQECEQGQVSFVYTNSSTYKNYFCAICNLGDDMEDAYLDIYQADQLASSISDSISETVIKLDYENKKCCVQCSDLDVECSNLTDIENVWGSVHNPLTNICMYIPYNSSCQDAIYPAHSIVYEQICPTSEELCGSQTHSTTTVPTFQPSLIRLKTYTQAPHGPVQDVFKGVNSHIRVRFKVVAETLQVETNDTFLFCDDDTIKSIQHPDRAIESLYLSTSQFQVKYKQNKTEKETYLVKLEWKDYDYVLISLSLAAIIAYMSYLVVKKGRHMTLPDKIMMLLLPSLMGALLSWGVLSVPANNPMEETSCKAVAALLQFFFLATLSWSSVLALSIVYSLFTMRLVDSSGHTKTLALYAMFGFGFPTVCVLITYALSRVEGEINAFNGFNKVYRTQGICFLYSQSHVTFYGLFLIPFFVLIGSNLILGVAAMLKVTKSGKIGSSQDRNRAKKNTITIFKLSACLGLGWILLYVAFTYENLWPAVKVFIEIQGVLIVLANVISWRCCNNFAYKTRNLFSKGDQQATSSDSAGTGQTTLNSSTDL